MKKQSILLGWLTSTALIGIVILGTAIFEHQLGQQATKTALELQIPHIKQQSPSLDTAKLVSREIMSQIFDVPIPSTGIVAGATTESQLNQEEIADISTPAVIRIFNRVSGTVSFPEFTVDLLNFNLVPTTTTYSQKLDSLVTGTGFFVDSKGHIVTNSHVIDKGVILEEFTQKALIYYGEAIRDQILNLNPDELTALEQKITTTYGDDPMQAADKFAYDVLEAVYKYITERAKIDAEQTITVLDPSGIGKKIKTEEDLKKLAGEGFPATIVDWRPDYAKSHKDVALIKIQKETTPFLNLNPNANPSTGQQIFVIGFPANAEVNLSDLFSRTMTQGSINSLKDLDETQIYQTDAKISPGSSGSPMLNEKGEVIGIISFLNNGAVGDNFGYAVPIEHALTLMNDNGVNPTTNPYLSSFILGLQLSENKLCRKANEQFALSKTSSESLSNPGLQKYIDRCNELISAGSSKDGKLYQATEFVKNIPIYAWAGGLVFVIITVGVIFFLRKTRKIEPIQTTQATAV